MSHSSKSRRNRASPAKRPKDLSPEATLLQPSTVPETYRNLYFGRQTLEHIVIYLCLVLVHVLMVLSIKYPSIYYDELVYIGFARYFSGGTMPFLYNGALGHFGYSLFLAPVFAVITGFAAQYKALLLVNCILLSTTYLSLYKIVRLLYPDIPHRVCAIASVLTCLYPSYLLYCTFAGSENAFVPVYTAVIAFTLQCFSKPTRGLALGVAGLAILTFAIHNRGLSVIAVLIVLVTVGMFRHRMPIVSGMIIVAGCTVGYLGVINAKDYLEIATGAPFPHPGAQAITWLSLKRFGLCLGGEIFSLCVSTVGLYVLSFVALARLAHLDFIRRQAAVLMIASHILVIFGSAFFISGQDLGRLDHLLIGRYNEGTLAPMLAVAVIFLYRFSKRLEIHYVCLWTAVGFIFVALFALLNSPQMPRLETVPMDRILRINMIGVMPDIRLLRTGDIESLALLTMLISALVVYLASVRWSLSITAIALTFVVGAAIVYNDDVLEEQRVFKCDRTGSPAGLSGALAELTARGVRDVGYDKTIWNPFFYSTYLLFNPELRFTLFDSRNDSVPGTTAIIAAPGWVPPYYVRVDQESMGGATLWVKK